MRPVDLLLPEFDHEIAGTRRVLERAPESAFAWRPHDKSWTLGELCTHLARLPSWGVPVLTHDSYDLVLDAGTKPPALTTPADVLAMFDQHAATVRAALLAASEGELLAPWSLKRGGVVLMSVPRIQAFKSFTLSHLIHHRGQLTVYLRLQNIPLPPLYGPTADEGA